MSMKTLMPLFGIILLTGCQNYIRNTDITEQSYERSVIRSTFVFKPYEMDQQQGKISLQLFENRTTSVKVYDNHRTDSISTPYEIWREIYEMPMGAIAFPVGVLCHIANIITFGLVPYECAWSVDCFALSALNPFLNLEDERRAVNKNLRVVRKLTDQREEYGEILKGHFAVTASTGKRRVSTRTDKQGVVRLSLLRPDGTLLFSNLQEQRIVVSAGTGEDMASYAWMIPRENLLRANNAANIIARYRQKPSGRMLAVIERTLEKYGFHEMACRLRNSELKRLASNRYFIEEYKRYSSPNP